MYNFDHLTNIISEIDIDALLDTCGIIGIENITVYGDQKAWKNFIMPAMKRYNRPGLSTPSDKIGWSCNFKIDDVIYKGFGWHCSTNFIQYLQNCKVITNCTEL